MPPPVASLGMERMASARVARVGGGCCTTVGMMLLREGRVVPADPDAVDDDEPAVRPAMALRATW